jgi:transcriptional regulator with XRE-family HTH domain
MPRKNPLAQREIKICQRLKAFRESTGLTRVKFAGAVGVDSSLLSRYENYRMAVRYEVFALITKRFNLRPYWLATGAESPVDDMPFDDSEFFSQIDQKALFSEIFDSTLAGPLTKEHYEKQIEMRRLKWKIEKFIDTIAPGRLLILQNPISVEQLLATIKTLAAKLEEAIQHAKDLPKKKGLTDVPLSGNVSSMKSPLEDLLCRLARATEARGKKAALAIFLKVTPPRISEWIHGAKEPSGETTLRLLKWVTAEEAQLKSPGDVTSATKGKTRSTQSKYEKRNTSPRPK